MLIKTRKDRVTETEFTVGKVEGG